MNITSDFTYGVLIATARKIARMHAVDPEKAADYFEMQAREMDDNELKMFQDAVVKAVVEQAA